MVLFSLLQLLRFKSLQSCLLRIGFLFMFCEVTERFVLVVLRLRFWHFRISRYSRRLLFSTKRFDVYIFLVVLIESLYDRYGRRLLSVFEMIFPY